MAAAWSGQEPAAGWSCARFRSVPGTSGSQARVTGGPFSAGTLCVSHTRLLFLEEGPSPRGHWRCLLQSTFPGQSQSQSPGGWSPAVLCRVLLGRVAGPWCHSDSCSVAVHRGRVLCGWGQRLTRPLSGAQPRPGWWGPRGRVDRVPAAGAPRGVPAHVKFYVSLPSVL